MRQAWHVSWYRLRSTFHRRLPGYLSVVLLIGLMGGLAMGSVAAARRTQSSFPTFLASTDPSTMSVFTGPLPVGVIAHLPHVRQVKSAEVLQAGPLGPNGAPLQSALGRVFVLGSADGMFLNQDRVSVLRGRMANPRQADKAVVTQEAAQLLGLRVGERVPFGFYNAAQVSSPRFGTAAVRPQVRADLDIVGTVVVNTAVVQDDASRSISGLVILTPALTSRVAGCCNEGFVEGGGFIPAKRAAQLLRNDPDVAGWTGVYFDSLRVDGLTIPIIGGTPGAALGPPILSGHTLEAANQIVLGAATLAELHKRVGDRVEASYGTISRRTTLRIVGTATMPAVGPGLGLHLSMGTGGLVSQLLIPAVVRRPTTGPVGPNAVFVRLRAGVSPSAAQRSLQRVDDALDSDPNAAPISLLSAQRPANIVNYRAMGTTPALLGAALATGAVVALGLTLVASVRRRRRDLALLKTLGFTRRQLAAVVAWQSSIAVFIGTVVGIPVGTAVGRVLCYAFAHEIEAVPAPATPALSIVLVGLGAFLLANVVAAVPALIASRTPTALVLRAE